VLRSLGPDGSFDAILLDADKEGLPSYVVEARRLLRPGGLLLVDNALWRGQVLDPAVTDPATEAIRRSHENLRSDPAFDTTLLPVGDGLLVALRR
jgi:predicted O-methyltransferase YrrM